MKFTKLNENTIKCQITNEELEAKGMHIEDILQNHEKAEEFLQDVLTEAKTETNFDAMGNSLNVQLSVMKDGTVSLIISNDRNAAIKALLNEVKGELKSFLAKLTKGGENPEDVIEIPSGGQLPMNYNQLLKNTNTNKLSSAKFDEKISMHIWAEIDSMEKSIALSRELCGANDIDFSKFYSYRGRYYFEIQLTDVRRNLASKIFILSEYSNFMYSDTGTVRELYEHGKLLIDENAVNVLSEMR